MMTMAESMQEMYFSCREMYFRGKACSKNNSLLERVDSKVQLAHIEAPGNGFLALPFPSPLDACHPGFSETHLFPKDLAYLFVRNNGWANLLSLLN